MSKSRGNVVTPKDLLTQYSVDAVRYWTARARLGQDTAFDTTIFQIGRRLAIKVFNASKFVVAQLDRANVAAMAVPSEVTEPVDRAFLAHVRDVCERATAAFEDLEYARALEVAESAFWDFCDNYIELVKHRTYVETDSTPRRSALASLSLALCAFLRLLAPVLPYVAEEAWSWRLAGWSGVRSVHSAAWPGCDTWPSQPETPGVERSYEAARHVLGRIRAAKAAVSASMRHPVSRLMCAGRAEWTDALRAGLGDLVMAGAIAESGIQIRAAEPSGEDLFDVEVELKEQA